MKFLILLRVKRNLWKISTTRKWYKKILIMNRFKEEIN